MKKKRRKPTLTPEERAARDAQFERTNRLLRERIEYYRAKLVNSRPGWDHPKTEEEWAAYEDAYIRKRIGLE